MSVRLVYKDIALGADEDAEVSASVEGEPFSDIRQIPFGVEASAIATGELNGWGLIPEYKVFDNQPVAFWSKERSGGDCTFATPPTITLAFSQQYTVSGLTVLFAPATMDYCSKMRATFYQAGAIVHDKTYYPSSPTFVISDIARAFDKLELVFEKTNLPRKRLKIDYIAMGVIREFEGDELTSASFLHEINPISDTLPANVLDATLHSNEAVDYVFQRKQPVEAYNGSELIGAYYIEHGTRTGARDYAIACSDILGVWDKEPYPGVVWTKDTDLRKALTHIFGDDIQRFEISPAFGESTIRGYIEPGTKRTALQHIAFAIGAIVDTSNSNKVKLYPPYEGITGAIPATNTYIGGSVEVGDMVTGISLTSYEITEETPGENDQYIELYDIRYKCVPQTVVINNPDTVASDLPNIIKYEGCYLVNSGNFWDIRDRLISHYMKREKYAFKHVLDGQMLGDKYTAFLPWGNEITGRITKMSITVTGLTVSETEMLLD